VPAKSAPPALFYQSMGFLDTGGTLGPWTTVTITGPKKLTISGLTLAGIYQFQIRALGKLGYTDWLDTKTFICA
jgi:hypothetical protein